MNMACCGKPRKAKFCPDCGKELKGRSPLQELHAKLLANVRQYAVASTRAEQDLQKALKETPGREDRYTEGLRRAIVRHRQTSEKWAEWARALEAVLAKAPPDGDTA